MDTRSRIASAVADTARDWRDPAYERRQDAEARATGAPVTEGALLFALNQLMHRLADPEAVSAWALPAARAPLRVVLRAESPIPTDGLRPLLAVLIAGHEVVVIVDEASRALLRAFTDDLQTHEGVPAVSFVEEQAVRDAEAWIDWTPDANPVPGAEGSPRFVRPERHGVAVLDGSEREDEREGWAEDVLLYGGQAPSSAHLVWAPRALDPDPYFNALAVFRSVFPAREALEGQLEMQRAFLEAGGHPHAYGECGAFLVSRGAPEVQPAGHVRWVAYDDLDEVRTWLRTNAAAVDTVSARDGLRDVLDVPRGPRSCAPGEAHRPPLGAARDEEALRSFLADLA